MLKSISKLKKSATKIDLSNIKAIVKEKSLELKENLDSVVEDPSLDNNTKINIIINATALCCAIVAVQPLPFADLFILSPIQVVMVTYLSKVIGMDGDKIKPNEILVYLIGSVGWGVLSQQAVIGLYKTVLPYAGGFTTIPLVYASTFALGICCKILIEARKKDTQISKEELKKIREKEIERIKKEGRNWSIDSLKKQFYSIDRKEFKEYREKLNSYDSVISKCNEFSFIDILNKKSELSKRLSIYDKIEVSDKVLYIICFIDSKNTIIKLENILAKINRGEINLNFDGEYCTYNIENLCKLHIINSNNYYSIDDIEVFDSEINDIFNLFSNKNEINHLKNEQIRDKFIQSIEKSMYELNIASPWMNHYVVNEELISKMDKCLKRGCRIKIIYGIKCNSNNERDNRSDVVAQKLKARFNIYGDNFKIKKVNSHYKVLISDNEFLIEGSYNFLSFSGEYDEDVRGEGATYNSDKKMIQKLRNTYFKF